MAVLQISVPFVEFLSVEETVYGFEGLPGLVDLFDFVSSQIWSEVEVVLDFGFLGLRGVFLREFGFVGVFLVDSMGIYFGLDWMLGI